LDYRASGLVFVKILGNTKLHHMLLRCIYNPAASPQGYKLLTSIAS